MFDYNCLSKKALVALCERKDEVITMVTQRYTAAKEVIDMTATELGINVDNLGEALYIPERGVLFDGGDTCVLLRKMKEAIEDAHLS